MIKIDSDSLMEGHYLVSVLHSLVVELVPPSFRQKSVEPEVEESLLSQAQVPKAHPSLRSCGLGSAGGSRKRLKTLGTRGLQLRTHTHTHT